MSGAQVDVENLSSDASSWVPVSLTISAWIEHAPSAFWLMMFIVLGYWWNLVPSFSYSSLGCMLDLRRST
jgi:hypothetical protein